MEPEGELIFGATMQPGITYGKRILVVEDEPGVRETLKMLLQLDGHKVVTARDGMEACHRYTPGDFDLVITDYSMPEMKGDELARTIKCLVPSQPILMLTAYAAELSNADNPVDAVLEKPFTIEALRRMIGLLSHSNQPAAVVQPDGGLHVVHP